MAKIPRGEDLDVYIPSGQSAVTTLDTRNVGAGLDLAGQAIGKAAQDLQARRVNYQLAQAEAEFLTTKVKLDNAFDNDNDYETIPDRYSAALEEAAGKSASMISDPRAREMFTLDVQPRVAEGRARIDNLAWNKEVDYQRGYIGEKLAGAREAVITGDVDAAVNAASGIVASAVDMGYYGREEGEQALRRWQDDAVSARLEVMPPQARLDALNQTWAQQIPADTRRRLELDAQAKVLQGKAQLTVDRYLASDMDRGQMLEEVRTITDPVEREAVTREMDYQLGQQRAAKQEMQNDLHNQYFLDVREGRMRVSDIPFKDLYAMEPPIVENLYAAESRRNAPGVQPPSDRDTLDTLFSLKAAGDKAGLRAYFQEHSAALDEEDFRRWSQITTEEMAPVEVEAVLSAEERIKSWAEGTFTGKKDVETSTRELTNKFETWYMDYQRANGKVPADTDQVRFIDAMTIEHQERSWWFGQKETPYFRLDSEQQAAFINNIRVNDQEGYGTVLRILGTDDPSSDLFVQAYDIYANP